MRRVLKSGGKFICLTLAESHVLGTVFTCCSALVPFKKNINS